MLTFFFVASIAVFFILFKFAIDGKLTPKEDWTAINKYTGKYERFQRKRPRQN